MIIVDLRFSFSGIKTASSLLLKNKKIIDEELKSNISASFQNIVSDILIKKFNDLNTKYKDDIVKRPNNWGGFIISPIEYEFWQGGENRLHDRIRYRLIDKKWIIDRLSP